MASAIRGLSQLAKLLLKLAKQERFDIDFCRHSSRLNLPDTAACIKRVAG
jgi:hypothetical protein